MKVCRLIGTAAWGIICMLTFTVPPGMAFQTHQFEARFGVDGTSATHFERPGSLAIDQSTGDIYVGNGFLGGTIERFNAAHEPAPFVGISPSIVAGKLTGFGDAPFPDQIAVSPVSQNLYFGSDASSIIAYDANGEPTNFTAGPGAGTNELPGTQVCGVAVDSNGNIYVSEWSTGVQIFSRPVKWSRIYQQVVYANSLLIRTVSSI